METLLISRVTFFSRGGKYTSLTGTKHLTVPVKSGEFALKTVQVKGFHLRGVCLTCAVGVSYEAVSMPGVGELALLQLLQQISNEDSGGFLHRLEKETPQLLATPTSSQFARRSPD